MKHNFMPIVIYSYASYGNLGLLLSHHMQGTGVLFNLE